MRKDETGPFDGELVAYLDGALAAKERAALDGRLASDPELRERLDLLARGGRPFGEAYATLLAAAPQERLRQNLERILAAQAAAPDPAAAPAAAAPRFGGWRFVPAALAACLALFALGFAAGHGSKAWLPIVASSVEEGNGAEAWRDVVADYLRLTTSQTLTAMRPTDGQLRDQLATVLDKVGLKVPLSDLDLEGRKLMKVELYHYDNTPLAQITYLDDENGPISLCVMARQDEPEAPEPERRAGMNIAYWSSPSHAFMLVGLAPQETLTQVATRLAPALGAGG